MENYKVVECFVCKPALQKGDKGKAILVHKEEYNRMKLKGFSDDLISAIECIRLMNFTCNMKINLREHAQKIIMELAKGEADEDFSDLWNPRGGDDE